MKLTAYVAGVGVLGPGLQDWQHAARCLSGAADYVPAPTQLPVPALLPAAERRRIGRVVKLAIAIAVEAAARAGVDPAGLSSVFSSSGGDGHNCHELCLALAETGREVSPTRFSNSVHNAAAGYWSIATGAKLDSNVLCAFDGSFCAGLLEAAVQVSVRGEPLLLVAYDTEYPEPIHAKRQLPDAFGAGFVLTPEPTAQALARLDVELCTDPADTMSEPRLELLRGSVPAARCMPLLRRLALREAGRTVLDYLDGLRLAVQVVPCG